MLLFTAALGVQAAYPDKPIRLVHAFAPGSSTDTAGRLIAERLSQRLGQPVVVENKPGANMMIGTTFAAKSPPDGYTMLVVTVDSMAVNPAMQESMGYKTSDFDGVTLIGRIPLMILGAPDLPYDDLGQVIKAARENNKEFNFATWGNGSVAHLIGAMVADQSKTSLNFVPFTGSAPALTALMGGHVDMAVTSPATAKDVVASGKAKALAVGGLARAENFAQTPTLAELGLGDVKATQWHAISVRAGGDKKIIDRLYKEITAIYAEPGVRAKLEAMGYASIGGMSPGEFSQFMTAESEAWSHAAGLIKK